LAVPAVSSSLVVQAIRRISGRKLEDSETKDALDDQGDVIDFGSHCRFDPVLSALFAGRRPTA
jgi:hypothetical protein